VIVLIKRILILAKDFKEGDVVSDYIRELSKFLSQKGIESHIVCFGPSHSEESHQNFHIHRVPFIINGDNIFNWSMLMNNELKRKAREIFEEEGFDIIHANDWSTAAAAMSLAKFTEKPLAVTLHSTEKERGFTERHSGIISDLEWWLTYEACCVIANTEKTCNSLRHDLQLPEEKIRLMSTSNEAWENEVLEIYERISQKSAGPIACNR
jgi:glycosyltransferase involved in cell wall biosynthesis